jgi:uncharacterized membrane protein
MPTLYNRIQGRNLERLAALSDGIFAVAMTLLVLDLHLPSATQVQGEGALLDALATLGPQWITYAMSFLTLGIFWAGQQTQLNYMAEGTRDLTWIHLGFLFAVTLLPLSTRLLTEFIHTAWRLASTGSTYLYSAQCFIGAGRTPCTPPWSRATRPLKSARASAAEF